MSRYFYAQYEREGGGSAWRPQPHGTSGGAASLSRIAPTLDEAYAVLWLRTGAPRDVVSAAYRALAAHHHPDTGGDAAAMRRLNEAYGALRARGLAR